jgi:hypothetical protein
MSISTSLAARFHPAELFHSPATRPCGSALIGIGQRPECCQLDEPFKLDSNRQEAASGGLPECCLAVFQTSSALDCQCRKGLRTVEFSLPFPKRENRDYANDDIHSDCYGYGRNHGLASSSGSWIGQRSLASGQSGRSIPAISRPQDPLPGNVLRSLPRRCTFFNCHDLNDASQSILRRGQSGPAPFSPNQGS